MIKQQISSSQSLDSLEAPEEYIPNEQRLANDLSEHDYDSNILRIMLLKYKEQQKSQKDMTKQSKTQKDIMRKILQHTFQQFQNQIKQCQDPYAFDMILTNMLTIKLQAHKFMEIALLNIGDNQELYSFYAQCATNMAYKLNIYCTVECLDDYHENNKDLVQIYQIKALEFENKINRALNWNCQLTTVSQFFHYFVDNHFSEKYNLIINENSEFMNDRIVDAYLEYKWSSISIALGYLSYIFQEDEEESDYLCFIIQHYQSELSQLGAIIDQEQILQVRDHLNNQDLLEEQYEGQEYVEVEEQEDEEEVEYLVKQQIQNNLNQNQYQQQQNEFDNVSSDIDLYYKRLSSSSSQTQNYEQEEFVSPNNAQNSIETQQIHYNKKRSSTQYNLQSCNKNLYNENTQEVVNKSRCYSQQLIYNQIPQDRYEISNGDEIRKKFKSSNVY
ncbi:hypothetical protein ABPG74_020324 [Tetrahymena malaccensis]